MDDKLSINISLADRTYPLKIDRAEEEKIRKAASLINQKLAQYKLRYRGKDSQDLLAMVVLQYATTNIEQEKKLSYSPLNQSIKDINSELETYLDNQQESVL